MLTQMLQVYFIQKTAISWIKVCILIRFEISKSFKKLYIVFLILNIHQNMLYKKVRNTVR